MSHAPFLAIVVLQLVIIKVAKDLRHQRTGLFDRKATLTAHFTKWIVYFFFRFVYLINLTLKFVLAAAVVAHAIEVFAGPRRGLRRLEGAAC